MALDLVWDDGRTGRGIKQTAEVGVRTKLLKAGWDSNYLAKVLALQHV